MITYGILHTRAKKILNQISDESSKNNSKFMVGVKSVIKICGLLACLYFFVVSLNLMSVSFPLIGGEYCFYLVIKEIYLTF